MTKCPAKASWETCLSNHFKYRGLICVDVRNRCDIGRDVRSWHASDSKINSKITFKRVTILPNDCYCCWKRQQLSKVSTLSCMNLFPSFFSLAVCWHLIPIMAPSLSRAAFRKVGKKFSSRKVEVSLLVSFFLWFLLWRSLASPTSCRAMVNNVFVLNSSASTMDQFTTQLSVHGCWPSQWRGKLQD